MAILLMMRSSNCIKINLMQNVRSLRSLESSQNCFSSLYARSFSASSYPRSGSCCRSSAASSRIHHGRLQGAAPHDKRLVSTEVDMKLDGLVEDEQVIAKEIDFPGGPVPFTSELAFISEQAEERVPCFRVLNDNGESIAGDHYEQISKDVALKIHSGMITLQIMDTFFYEAQRQGRISFYMTSFGEEAVNLASAAAISKHDPVFAQYREPGVLLWRGFTPQEFAAQLFGNRIDGGKGRQMASHYGSKKLNFFTISSPIATQLPQAVGAAYSLKLDNSDACVVAYMGDGCTSEGDFHAGMNFAAVLEVPIVFICRNNGWAISTAVTEQFRSDGVVVKGQGYGMKSIRVDGNDVLAVYNVVRAAREMAVLKKRPILVEALTYRVGHHSTSDDSTKYRQLDEIKHWKQARNPLTRFGKWMEAKGWWNEKLEVEIRSNVTKEMIQAVQTAERLEKPALSELFSDVYDALMPSLCEQELQLRRTVKQHPKDYPSDVPL